MKSLAVISEFNPFHNGHSYLVKRAIKDLEPDLSISLMSGDFVQRGEAGIMDKFFRAKAAVYGGFDLVIEMPSFVTLQSASYFAEKSIKILGKLRIDYLAFGIEGLSKEEFLEKSSILIKNNYSVDKRIGKLVKTGISYTLATNKIIKDLVGEDFLMANNILGLAYLRAIDKLGLPIKAYPISRLESFNSDRSIDKKNFASSTAIRDEVKNPSIKKLMPYQSYRLLDSFLKTYGKVNPDDIYTILKYKILVENKGFKDILGYEEGLDNFFRKSIDGSKTYKEFLNKASTNRYTRSRIRRVVLNYILDNKTFLNDIDINFIKVLAFNKKAAGNFKNLGEVKLIIRKSDTNKLNEGESLVYKKIIESSNLYSLLLKRNPDYDFRHNNRAVAKL